MATGYIHSHSINEIKKRKMKGLIHFFTATFLWVLVVGCDNSELYLEQVNDLPSITIMDQADTTQRHQVWTDSAKKSTVEFGLFPYQFQLYVEDFNSNIQVVDVRQDLISQEDSLNGFLLFQYDTILIDVQVTSQNVKKQTIDIEVLAFDESMITLTFIAFDDFLRSDTCTLFLNVFDNASPVVEYEVKDDPLGEVIKNIDLSNSYDQDAAYGGRIISYHWIIEGSEFSLTRDFIQYSFPGSGSYNVQVYVVDNNSTQSQFKTVEVIIP